MHEANGDDRPAVARHKTRLALLEALSDRLSVAGVPHVVKHHVPNLAPTYPTEDTIPALIIGGQWCRVRVLYWLALDDDQPSQPWYVVWDSWHRWATDEAGIDRLASILTVMWLDAVARGEVNDR